MQKKWIEPQLTTYGTVEEITKQKTVIKRAGAGDDFSTSIQTQPPGTPLSSF